jgi:hypothetical protein
MNRSLLSLAAIVALTMTAPTGFTEHLAVIEMRGDRIFKMRNFTT